jgi:hypothetical protein
MTTAGAAVEAEPLRATVRLLGAATVSVCLGTHY